MTATENGPPQAGSLVERAVFSAPPRPQPHDTATAMLHYPLGGGAGLGPLEPWHAEEFAAVVGSAREHLAPWIPFAHTVVDVDSARAFLQGFADSRAADSRHCYGIWQDDKLVGGVLFPKFDPTGGACEVGVWLAPEAQGLGLVTRAARCLIDWAIRNRGMSRVEWKTDPRNARSKAVAVRLGMTFEGVLRSSFLIAGERRDTEVWSVLADEWRNGHQEPGRADSTGHASIVGARQA